MAKRQIQRRNGGNGNPALNGETTDGTTGRYLVVFKEGARPHEVSAELGIQMASASDFEGASVRFEEVGDTDGMYFAEIGAAILPVAPGQAGDLQAMAAGSDSPILAMEPERIAYALLHQSFLHGFKAGVDMTVERLLASEFGVEDQTIVEAEALDESRHTWGLQATRVAQSRMSGRGVRVAVLDTGLDFGHPDFRGRAITSASFITGETAQDGHGHGTHCAGTAVGPLLPTGQPRYGCAFNAELFAGKVLSNSGRGPDGGILAGLNWALTNGCDIVSMSLGSLVRPGEGFPDVYEVIAQRALRKGMLIVAAAGNDSRRPGSVLPVSRPANCPSILAVGAVNSELGIAPFSNRSINPNGGQVDIAAPGVNILSSVPLPLGYRRLDGTSMAAPHVAGIAAMHIEASGARGVALWTRLQQAALRLPLGSIDVGSGLVLAP